MEHLREPEDTNNSKNNNKVYINDTKLENVIIVNDNSTNNIVKPLHAFVASEENIFLGMLKQVHERYTSIKQKDFTKTYLIQKRQGLLDKISEAYNYYVNANFEKALDFYEESIRIIENDEYPDEYQLNVDDIHSIKYCIALCNLQRKKTGSLQTAISQLKHLIDVDKSNNTWPVLYFSLAEAHLQLMEFVASGDVLRLGLKFVNSHNGPVCPNWPVSDVPIINMDLDMLQNKMKEFLKQSTIAIEPDGLCCYVSCSMLGNTQKSIYFNSPGFDGYSILNCSSSCRFYYHRNCWRRFTKDSRRNNIYAVEGPCHTPNCNGYLSSFQIYDEKGKLKTTQQFASPKSDLSSDLSSCGGPVSTLPKYRFDNLFCISAIKEVKKSDTGLETHSKRLTADVPEFLPGKKYLSSRQNSLISSKKIFKSEFCQTLVFQNKSSQTQTKIATQEFSAQFVPKMSAKMTQTSSKLENIETKAMRAHIRSLNLSLFESEENYNLLLNKKKCPTCKRIDNDDRMHVDTYVQTHETMDTLPYFHKYVALTKELNKIREKYLNLETKCDNLNQELQIEKRNNSQESSFEDITIKLTELEIKNKQLNECLSKKDRELEILKKALVQEQQYSRTTYNCFLNEFIGKCNKTIYELGNLERLVNPQTQPSFSQVKACQFDWLKCQSLTIQYMLNVQKFYDDQLNVFWMSRDSDSMSSVQRPCPGVPNEPPSIFMQYLKVSLQEIHRLNQIMQRQNWTACQIQSQPLMPVIPQTMSNIARPGFMYVGMPPHQTLPRGQQQYCPNQQNQENRQTYSKLSETRSQNFVEKHSENRSNNANSHQLSQDENNQLKTEKAERSQSDEDMNCNDQTYIKENEHETLSEPLKKGFTLDTEVCSGRNSAQTSQDGSASSRLSMSDHEQCCVGESQELTCETQAEIASITQIDFCQHEENCIVEENNENYVPDDQMQNFNASGVFKMMKSEKSQSHSLKMMSVLTKLKYKCFPEIPMEEFIDAVNVLRNRHGKLSGMSMKEIGQKIHKILFNDKNEIKASDNGIARNKQPWGSVGMPVWNREQSDFNCPICFEFMELKETHELTCGHQFHSTCIKTWLGSNSICPICRIYTTPEDDYPPLGKKS